MKNLTLIEKLGFFNCLFQIGHRLLRAKGMQVYVIDAVPPAFWFLRFLGRLVGFQVEKLKFYVVEVKDETGLSVRLRIPYQDAFAIQKEIADKPIFGNLCSLIEGDDRWITYVVKTIHVFDCSSRRPLFSKALLLVQLSLWQARKEKISGKISLFLNQSPWRESVARYAEKYGVEPLFVWSGVSFDPRNLPWFWLKRFYYYLLHVRWCLKYNRFLLMMRTSAGTSDKGREPKIAVEYYGHFNLDKPACYSDFFFWQQSDLSPRDLMAFFYILGDPFDEEKQASLKAKGIQKLILDPRASLLAEAPPYFPEMKKMPSVKKRVSSLRGLEKKWAKEALFDYEWLYCYWKEIFEKHHTKIYVSWYKYDGAHCPMGCAMRDVGGLLALYQRALDLTPSLDTQLHCDVYFAFSPRMAELERMVGSKVPYFVITGYLGDHRLSLLKKQAETVRSQLQASGAKYIISFTDENSVDSRWHTGHEFMRVHYAFLLEKLLQNPWMGLVLKPKVPHSLRQRLGEINILLERALKTGRCFLYEEGPIQGTYPPAAAALSADIAVHGHLCGPTAAFEAALAGTPTVLLDREGWSVSPLYQLGEGKVVFKDWETLWAACMDHRRTPTKDHPVGCWGEMLNQLDPFRDGKAAYRMGTYLKWLIEGFKQGRRREDILTEAAHRYQKNWGQDKIISV